MILVLGPRFSGKTTYLRSLGLPADAVADDAELLVAQTDEDGLDALMEYLAGMRVVAMGDIQRGVVPSTARERRQRDRAGRAQQHLAMRAERVVLMCCGIPLSLQEGPCA
ncbi:hypothetical protein HLV37_05545 [Eggerthellaceae bacterium zg-1084]|uniref:bifunctional adenosylcobinamide kinase/adenosylcobinamide-phosphate guanylyltransferase n=1 Tax=Berryella wangjianweii TaxID=2734634 RepID=UPI001555FCD6|nr:bifunctional adenosylcobinamide kinase/adenosylcobinamide-phosphate guanylyltransferase [Berryella wangjianweii]NPD31326.1 hypothetical protein [Berryella wangjianweii]